MRGEIQAYIPEGAPADVPKITDTIARALEIVLLGCRFVVFPRSRWTHSDTALDQLLLFEGLHSLMSEIFPLWRHEVSGTSKRCAKGGAGHVVGAAPPRLQRPPGAGGDVADGDVAMDDVWGAGAESGGPASDGEDAGGDAPDDPRRDNARQRRIGGTWLAGRPFAMLVISRC